MTASVAQLVNHFRRVHIERMQGMPILNPALEVQAIGFRELEEHLLGVLITPWFMNLVLLPGSEEWSEREQGKRIRVVLPHEEIDFNVTHDDAIGTHLTAVLFRTVADFPDQDTAVEIATEIMKTLFVPPEKPEEPKLSRRQLFTRIE